MRKGLESALGMLIVLVLATACASPRDTQGGFLDTRYTAEELNLPDAEKEDIVVCNADPRNPEAVYLVTESREVYALIREGTAWRYAPIAGGEVYFSADRPRQAAWDDQAWNAAPLPGPPGYVAVGDADRTAAGAELYVSRAGSTDQIRYGDG